MYTWCLPWGTNWILIYHAEVRSTSAPLCGGRLRTRAGLRSADFLLTCHGHYQGCRRFEQGEDTEIAGFVWKFRPQNVPESRLLSAHSLPQDLLTSLRLCYLRLFSLVAIKYSGQNTFWNNFSFFCINIWRISLFLNFFFFQNPKVRGHVWLAP
jgi:hypothetical protein